MQILRSAERKSCTLRRDFLIWVQNSSWRVCGTEALRCLLEGDFPVVLRDVRMPDMDDFEIAELIRCRPRSKQVPILFV